MAASASAIHRFDIDVTTGPHTLPIEPGSIVSVGPDHIRRHPGTVQVWAQRTIPIDPASDAATTLDVVATGSGFDAAAWRHVGTAVTPEGLVWHVIEQRP